MRIHSVVNLFGGPGIGKSTLAAKLFSALKEKQCNVEVIPEYAKDLTWEKRHLILAGDQGYVFAKQNRRLLRVLKHIDIAVCESPLVLAILYFNEEADFCDKDVFINYVLHIFNKYPNINYVIKRNKNDTYQPIGRNQTEAEAIEKDNEIIDFLTTYNIPFMEVDRDDAFDIIMKNDRLLD